MEEGGGETQETREGIGNMANVWGLVLFLYGPGDPIMGPSAPFHYSVLFSLLFVLLFPLRRALHTPPERCREADEWPLNGRPLVRDYRGRVLLLVFVALKKDDEGQQQQCAQELHRLDALPDQFPDVRVLAVAHRDEPVGHVRALAWKFPRIRFEQESAVAPVWDWFRAKHRDQHVFDRCSRLVSGLSAPSSTTTISALRAALSSRPCGHCEFDSPNHRVHWPSFHPPVTKVTMTTPPPSNVPHQAIAMPRMGVEAEERHWRRWNTPANNQRDGTKRLHWTMEGKQGAPQGGNGSSSAGNGAATIVLHQSQQQQFVAAPQNAIPQQRQRQYLYGQQMGGGGGRDDRDRQMEERERERLLRERERTERHWAEQKRLREQQERETQDGRRGSPQEQQQRALQQQRQEHNQATGPSQQGVRYSQDPYRNQRQQQQQNYGMTRGGEQPRAPPTASTAKPTAERADPAPLYPEGSEDAGGEDYYGDEYAAEWTTERPESEMQIPKPTKPVQPTTPTTQAMDKNFGFELPCTGFTDESCFQQQSQLRPSEIHRCCRGRILFTDQCMAGKCSNNTVQLCCIQRFFQAKLSCCSDERQANADVGDTFSRCCFDNFVDADDPCCPRPYAADQWRSVHELCLPNVEMDLTGVKVPAPLLGTSLITEFDFSKTDKWRFECRYGGHVQQYSFFEESASEEGGGGTDGETAEEEEE